MKLKFRIFVRKLLRNEAGATAIEYGLIAALIAVALIAGANTMGKRINSHFVCTGLALEVGHEVDNPKDAWEQCIKFYSR